MKLGLFLFFSFVYWSSTAQPVHLREDGFYFYDNNVDTLYLLKGDLFLEAQLRIAAGNDHIKLEGEPDCIPSGAVPLGGSSYIQLFRFFGGNKGAYTSTACWTKNNYKDHFATLDKRSKGVNLSSSEKKSLFTVKHLPHNKFLIQFDAKEHNAIIVEGQIFKDELIIIQRYPTFPGGFTPPPDPPKTFKFYPNGTIPPFRDKFVIQYKNPF